ncbi:MAG TPA: DUF2993 domain-containing protein [Actinomycetaceae bacterium]|nr:DUF2993 domain-containing protein [Actinomycetaceae bacterium]
MRRLATIVLLVAPVLLAAGLVADHEARNKATQGLTDAVVEHADGVNVDVNFEGFPFLTQVWAGRLNDVNVEADSVTTDEITAHDIRLVARGVDPSQPHQAELLEINATLPTEALDEAIRARLGPVADAVSLTRRGDGLTLHIDLPGASLQLLLGFEMSGDATIGLAVDDVLLGDVVTLPEPLRDGLAQALSAVSIDLPQVPEGLSLTVARIVDDGLRIRLEGRDVELGEYVN